jgi:hypothetical protein
MKFVARRLHSGLGSTKNILMNNQFESTYALLVRSEDRNRNVLEVLLYAIAILTAVAGILQFAHTPVKISAPGIESRVACATVETCGQRI